MPQARSLTPQELRRVLDHVAALKIGDVIGRDSQVKPEIRLAADQTKGRHARVVFVSERLRREIATYLRGLDTMDASLPLFATQKREGFSANTPRRHAERDLSAGRN